MRINTKSLASVLALFLLVFVARVAAQETTATVTGQVTDSTGAVVSGAEVTLTNIKTRETRTTKAGEDGYYSLP
ncbi:MAG TPA: carboxypeptidase-like regulatory domain-containing protein, partial [Blastocatellia bacterium]|nr:carboxypeptidase-like regulatory domain-containing protein [Blastocatellia bacterium]